MESVTSRAILEPFLEGVVHLSDENIFEVRGEGLSGVILSKSGQMTFGSV